MRPELMNALAVAYLGDAVFEVYVREYLLTEKGIMKPHELQRASIKYVSAYAHAGFMKYALSKNFFTEEEVRLFKRGRNCKGHSVKNKSVVVHNQSSGFESMVGHLYLTKQTERLDEIFELFKSEKGEHFDPKVIEAFFHSLDEIKTIRERFKDI